MDIHDFSTKFNHYIFDFDGTLFDTADDVVSVLQQVLIKKGVSYEGLSKSLIGPRLECIIKSLDSSLSDDEVQSLVTEFRSVYSVSSFPLTRPYSGIPILLTSLKECKKKIYIATNKPYYLVKQILQKSNMMSFFDEVVSFDIFSEKKISKSEMVEYIAKKWVEDSAQAVVIGDTCDDIRAGALCGISTCGVCYGYGPDFSECEPDFIVKEPLWLNIDDNLNLWGKQ